MKLIVERERLKTHGTADTGKDMQNATHVNILNPKRLPAEMQMSVRSLTQEPNGGILVLA